ncbi:MAG: LysE family translocator [Cryobacterium sp.]|nr:LysE family translocator [Cryobacterium sp.]
MGLEQVAAFWAISILFVITPGADWAYAITAGLRFHSTVPAVLGMLAGHLLATLVVATGLGVVVASVPGALPVLTIVGSLYLIWLGIGMLRSKGSVHATEVRTSGSTLGQFARGLGVSGLNPKVFLLFLALLPQFTDATGSWPLGAQMMALGLVHVASCALVYLVVGFAARRMLAASPTAARVVTRISGIAMMMIGALLIVERIAAR